MNSKILPLFTALAAALPAQITYVDASAGTNTTLATGAPFTPNAATSGIDNNWSVRVFANGGSIYESHSATASNEDAPMLRTTITGLAPGVSHNVYAYFWNAAPTPQVANWRGRATLGATQPTPPIQGYNARHAATSTFLPMTPLAVGAPVGYQQVSLGLTYDTAGMETSGHFANPVMFQEGNRFLFEVLLGTFTADPNGEILVWIDDQEGNLSSDFRTWYDGVGYEWAPLPLGAGCGNPAPTIGFQGAPILGTNFTVTLAGAAPSSLALLAIGFDATAWNGLPLPASLGFLGYPGCTLNVSPAVNLLLFTDANGTAQHAVSLGGVPSITLYWQWGVLGAASLDMTAGLSTAFHR